MPLSLKSISHYLTAWIVGLTIIIGQVLGHFAQLLQAYICLTPTYLPCFVFEVHRGRPLSFPGIVILPGLIPRSSVGGSHHVHHPSYQLFALSASPAGC